MMKKSLPLGVMVGALVFAVGQAAAQSVPPLFDHVKCYKVKPQKGAPKTKARKYLMDLIPEQANFNVETGCKLVDKPKLFCIDVQKTNVEPPAPITAPGRPAQDYLCYKIKCHKGEDVPVTVTDQFGTRNLLTKKPAILCVPAYKQGFPTPVPPTPTPTPQPTPVDVCEKNLATGMCGGPCPHADEVCDFVPGTGKCDCIKVGGCALDDATGKCAGLCPNVDDVCVFFPPTNRCDCVPPPPRCEDFPSGQGLCGGPCPPNYVCDDDLAGLPCRCYPTFPCGSLIDATCGGYCPTGTSCVPLQMASGCICM